jgi:hypothetical protein
MNIVQDSGPTSNDLLQSLVAKHVTGTLAYQIVAQSAEEIQDIDNAPAVSMRQYLLGSGQLRLLTAISIYSMREGSREEIQLLFMNAAAIRIWKEMGKTPRTIGALVRPPHKALLAFGVPFSK